MGGSGEGRTSSNEGGSVEADSGLWTAPRRWAAPGGGRASARIVRSAGPSRPAGPACPGWRAAFGGGGVVDSTAAAPPGSATWLPGSPVQRP